MEWDTAYLSDQSLRAIRPQQCSSCHSETQVDHNSGMMGVGLLTFLRQV